jgi:hypothetical protein
MAVSMILTGQKMHFPLETPHLGKKGTRDEADTHEQLR